MTDHSIKMKETREQWAAVGMAHTSLMLPEKYRTFFKGVFSVMAGEILLDAIEQHDEDTLEAFSNRQPRLNFEEADIHLMYVEAVDAGNDDLVSRCKNIMELFMERHRAVVEAKKALSMGEELKARYFFAREYAICHLIRGAHEITQAHMKEDGVPLKIKDYL